MAAEAAAAEAAAAAASSTDIAQGQVGQEASGTDPKHNCAVLVLDCGAINGVSTDSMLQQLVAPSDILQDCTPVLAACPADSPS